VDVREVPLQTSLESCPMIDELKRIAEEIEEELKAMEKP
jgi:hypothetical protein